MHPPMPPLPPPPPHSRPPLHLQPSRYIDRFLGDRQEYPTPTSPRSATDDGSSITTTTDIDDPSSDDSFLSDNDSVHLRPSSVDPPPGQSQFQSSPPPRHVSRRSGSVTAQPRPRSRSPYMSRSPGSHQNSVRDTAVSLGTATRNAPQTGRGSVFARSPSSGPSPGPSPDPPPVLSSDPSHYPISPPPPYTSRPFGHRREHSAPLVRLLSRPY